VDYRNDEEQMLVIKQWWSHYGSAIIVGLILGLLILLGIRYWNQHKISLEEEASVYYQEAVDAFNQLQASKVVSEQDVLHTQFNDAADILMDNYKNTPYAALAALLVSKEALDEDHRDDAVHALKWVINEAHEPLLTQLARVRLARVYLAENKPDDALSIIEAAAEEGNEYASELAEAKGDALLAKNQPVEAKAAYEQAFTVLDPEQQQMRGLLQIKIDNL